MCSWFFPFFILLSSAFSPWWGNTQRWLLDSTGPSSLGVQADVQQPHTPTALFPAYLVAVSSIAPVRSTRVSVFAAQILPSRDHAHALIMVMVCCSGVIHWQCVSPEDFWIHAQGETPLGCQAVNCTQRRTLWGYCKRIIVLFFASQWKPATSLILQRSGIK